MCVDYYFFFYVVFDLILKVMLFQGSTAGGVIAAFYLTLKRALKWNKTKNENAYNQSNRALLFRTFNNLWQKRWNYEVQIWFLHKWYGKVFSFLYKYIISSMYVDNLLIYMGQSYLYVLKLQLKTWQLCRINITVHVSFKKKNHQVACLICQWRFISSGISDHVATRPCSRCYRNVIGSKVWLSYWCPASCWNQSSVGEDAGTVIRPTSIWLKESFNVDCSWSPLTAGKFNMLNSCGVIP